MSPSAVQAERKILHLDLDAFFCSVEELRDPALAGKPFAVGGRPQERGVVASCSYPARLKGVHSAMPMGQALRLCPELIVIPSRHREYGEVSRQVMERLRRLTERIEQVSIDEAFLDVSDLPDPPEQIARRLQQTINTELRLPCSLGAAPNKLLAKIANDVGKAAQRSGRPPNAITVVPSGQEAAFLAPLPAERLWGVGPKTAARLAEIGIHTIGELARCPERELKRLFGKNGSDLLRHAQGIDTGDVVTFHEPRSVSQETTFARDVRDGVVLRKELNELARGAGQRLRNTGCVGTTVKLKLRWADFTTITRQVTLPAPTDQDDQIVAAALALFEKTWPPKRPVRLLGVGVSGLKPPVRQLTLWEALPPTDAAAPDDAPEPAQVAAAAFPHRHGPEDRRRLDEAVAQLEQRYGKPVVRRGAAAPHVQDLPAGSLQAASNQPVVVIGAGPAGLMAAEQLIQRGLAVHVFDAKPSAGRKLLVAGKGGLNLTHSEPLEVFLARYGSRCSRLEPLLRAFGPDELRRWAAELGFETFVGSSGRVFPEGMKAAPLLRAWLQRLQAGGAVFHFRCRWTGWDAGEALTFATPEGERRIPARAVILALGGGSWPRLGSTGEWAPLLAARGVDVAPLRPANCGFNVGWSEFFRERFAGQPVKNVVLTFETAGGETFRRQGEFVVTQHGVEGSLIYAVAAALRDALEAHAPAHIYLDLAPRLEARQLEARLQILHGKRSLSGVLERAASLKGVNAGLLRELVPPGDLRDPRRMAGWIKRLPLAVLSPRPLEEAISSAGGVRFEALDARLMLTALPGVFCAGEMLDWEAPTGGYLLTACFATGRAAGLGAAVWLAEN